MLLPCPSCKRHVRISESACPFCSQRLKTRARHRAFAALALAGATACGSTSIPIYGAPGDGGGARDPGTSSGTFPTDAGDAHIDAAEPVDAADIDAADIDADADE